MPYEQIWGDAAERDWSAPPHWGMEQL